MNSYVSSYVNSGTRRRRLISLQRIKAVIISKINSEVYRTILLWQCYYFKLKTIADECAVDHNGGSAGNDGHTIALSLVLDSQ